MMKLPLQKRFKPAVGVWKAALAAGLWLGLAAVTQAANPITAADRGTLATSFLHGYGAGGTLTGPGGTASVHFQYTNYRTNEAGRTVFLPRDRSRTTTNPVTIRFNGVPGTQYSLNLLNPSSAATVASFSRLGYIQGSSDLAIPNRDYAPPFSYSGAVPNSGIVSIAINLIDDNHAEFNEDILMSLSVAGVVQDIATFTIEHDDEPGGAVDLEFTPDPPYDDSNPNPGANGPVHAIKEVLEEVNTTGFLFYTGDVNTGGNTITATNSSFRVGDRVTFRSSNFVNPTNGLPDGLHQVIDQQGSVYVVNANGNTFSVSATLGGNPINLRSVGLASQEPFTVTQVIDGARTVLIGGDFTAVNLVPVNRIARVLDDGSVDPTFDVGTGADGFVDDIAVQPDGKILIGGGFTAVNGYSREGIARLETNGVVDVTFDPVAGISGEVRSVTVVTNGVHNRKIVVGGDFTTVNSTNRNHLARLNSDGRLDPTFDIGAGPNGPVYATAVQLDGKVIIGGEFTEVNGVARNRIARLNASGAVDLSFNPGAGLDDTVYDLELVSIGGAVGVSRSAGGGFAEDRFTFDTGVTEGSIIIDYDFLFEEDTMNVYYEGTQIYTTGFTNGTRAVQIAFGPGTSTQLEIVMNEGGHPTSLTTIWSYSVTVVPKQGVEKILVGGAFDTFDFRSRRGVARLNVDGSLDTSFNPGTGTDDTVFTVAQQEDGKFIIGGLFTSYNETARTNLARLFFNGALDTSFMDTAYNQQAGPYNASPIVRSHINDLSIQSDGHVLIGGAFTAVGGSHGRLGNGLQVGGRQYIGTVIGNTWPTIQTNSMYSPQDYVLFSPFALNSGTNVVRLSQCGGGGGTRWGTRNRGNFARVIGGETPTHDMNGDGLDETGGPGNMGFTRAYYGEDENGSNAVIEVTRTFGRLGTVSANMVTVDKTANAGADYLALATNRTWIGRHNFEGVPMFSAGDLTNKIFEVPILDDVLVEGDETLSMVFTNPVGSQLLPETTDFPPSFYTDASNVTHFAMVATNVALGAAKSFNGSADLTVFDNDFNFGVFDFAVTNFFVDEGAGVAVVTVTRSQGSVGNVVVQYSTVPGGSATLGTDYLGVTNTLAFAPGQTHRTFTVPIVNDTQREFDESIHLILTNPNGIASLGPRSFATLTLLDDDNGGGTVSFTTNSFNIVESGGAAAITLKRTSGSLGAATVTLRVRDGVGAAAASENTHFQGFTRIVNFADGQTEATEFVTVIDNNDTDTVAARWAILELVNPTGNIVLGTDDTARLYIENDDFNGQLRFMTSNFYANEDSGAATITVVRTDGSVDTVSATVAIGVPTTDTASSGSDYVGNATTVVTLVGGQTQASFQIPLVDDSDLEAEETVTLTLSDPSVPGLLANPMIATLILIDDESLNRPAGSDDTYFNPGLGPNNFVFATAIAPDRKIALGGAFDSVNGTSRSKLARLNLPGDVDISFDPGTGANDVVNAIQLQPDGRILFAGAFTRYADTNRFGVGRVLPDGDVDTTFNPGAGTDNPALDLALNTNGTAVIVGEFSTYNGVNRNRVALIDTNGALVRAFDPGTGADDRVRAVALHTNGVHAGKAVVVGDFREMDGTVVNRIARLNLADGSVDAAFTAALGLGVTNGAVHAVAIQPLDGKILVGGVFTSISGVDRFGIARLNADGSLDSSFDPGTGVDNTVMDIAVQPDGKILIVGDFTSFNGIGASRITRLNPDGTLDPTINFGSGANNFIASVSIQADEKIVIGGGFTEYNGVPRNYLARIIGGTNPGAGLFQFASASFVANESDQTALVTVTRSYGVDTRISVPVQIVGGTAAAGTHYDAATPTTTNLVFEVGQTSRSFSIALIDGLDPGQDRTILLQLGGAMDVTDEANPVAADVLGALTDATLTIRDNDSTLQFGATSYSVSEGGGTAIIQVRRVGGAVGAVSVRFATTNNTALAGFDYTGVTNTLNFADGESVKTFGVPILEDSLVEGDEELTLILFNPNPIGVTALGTLSQVPLRIIDNDLRPGVLNFTSSRYAVDENATNAVITVVRTNGTTGTVTVNFTTRDGLAVGGQDYTPTNGVLTFPEGVTTRTFSVGITEDMEGAETNETIVLLLERPQGGASLGGQNTAILEILNNNGFLYGEFAFEFPTYTVSEGAVSLDVTVRRLRGTSGEVKVNVVSSNVTAVAGLDYTAVSETLTFADGVTSQTVTIPIIDESPELDEADETFVLQLVTPLGGASLGAQSSATLTISDDDNLAGELGFSAALFDVNETFTNAVIEVVRTNGSAGNVSVSYSTAAGSATEGEDYTETADVLNFAAGETNKTFEVPIFPNPNQEGHFTVNLSLANATDGAIISRASAVLRIIDNEPAAGSSDETFAISPGANDFIYSAVRFDQTGQLLVGGDFTLFNGETRSNVARINLDGTLDHAFDPINVSLKGGKASVRSVSVVTNGVNIGKVIIGGRFDVVGGTNRANVARLNLDGSVDLGFTPGTGPDNFVHVVVAQNDGRVVIGGEFTSVNGLSRNHIARLNEDGSVDLSFAPGFAANGIVRDIAVDLNGFLIVVGDFTAFNGIAAGGVVRLRTDGSVDKTFDAGLGANGPVFSVALAGTSGRSVIGGEFTSVNGASGTVRIARLKADGTVDASFQTGSGPDDIVHDVALQSDDRIIIGGGFISYAGVTNVNRFARLEADGDLDPTFNGGSGANGFVATVLAQLDGDAVIGGGFTEVNGLIRNRLARLHGGENIGVGDLSFASAAYTVEENGLNAVISVIRTRALSGSVSVDYSTFEGTAVDGINYTNVSGTLVFAQSESAKSFSVPIVDDANPFGDRTINLSIHDSRNVTTGMTDLNLMVAPTNAVLSILDNDGVVGFQSAFFTVSESATNATISVVRDGGAIEPLTVDFAVSDGTANAIVDYTVTNGTLSFSNGQTVATFEVPIFNDTKTEGPETVTLTLSNLVGSAFLSQKQASLRIIDDEFNPGYIEFASIDFPTNENSTNALIKIVRTHGASGVVSADFATTNGTALAGSDYQHTAQPVTFADGEIERVVPVPIVNDALLEGDETVNLTLLNPTGGAGLSGFGPFGVLDTNYNFGVDATTGTPRGPNGIITDTEVQADGRVIVAGLFNTWSDSGGSTFVNGLVRLLPNGDLDLTFNPGVGPNSVIFDVLVQPDQNIVVAGAFTQFNTNAHNRIVRLLPTGTVDTNFLGAARANNIIRSVDIRQDGRLVIGGDFTMYDTAAANRLALLNTDGTLNTGFNAGAGPNGSVDEVVVQPDNRVVIGGYFRTYDGTNNVNYYTRVLANGNLDVNFWNLTSGGANLPVTAVALHSDGRILLGGAFNSVNPAATNSTQNGIARLLPSGALDTSFNPGTGADSSASLLTWVDEIVVVQPSLVSANEKILVGGTFNSFNGVARNRIERLNFDGSRDTSFEPCSGFDGRITDFTLQADGQLIVGGSFTMFSGQTIANLARLQPGLAIGLAMSTLTIVDNDVELGFSTNLLSVAESASTITIDITRTGLTNQTFDALFSVQDGPTPATAAAAGFDYVYTNGVVTFGPGETNKTFELTILEDTLIEGDEELVLTLESPTGAQFVGYTSATVTIVDNDDTADLAVIKTATQDPIYKGMDFSYTITVTNAGPSTLNGVSIVDTLPTQATLDLGSLPVGADLNIPGYVSFDVGQIAAGGTHTVTFNMTAPNVATFVTNSVSVAALELQNGSATDPDLANNNATLVTAIREDQAFISRVGARVVSESLSPANGAIDPGETVTLNLFLRNSGNLDTAGNVTASLIANSDITPGSPASQDYGVMRTTDAPVGREFQFTANGTNGQLVNVMLQVLDGTTPIHDNIVTFPFVLGSGASATNSAYIAIVEEGEALPYPSSVTVSGVTGFVSKVALTLSNFNHTYPDDVDILLVGPTGQGVVVMSDVGGGVDAVDLTLTIDDQADTQLPDGGPLTSGLFRPANHFTRDETPDDFPSPAPAGPFASLLSAFNGSNPNGVWSLYVVDDSRLDTGSIAGGWSLDISTVFAVDPVANLALSVAAAPDPVQVGSNLVYTLTVTNLGPTTASNVTLVDRLPLGATVVDNGGGSLSGGQVTFALGDLLVGESRTNMFTITPYRDGIATNSASVSATQPDPAPENNVAVTLTGIRPAADLMIVGAGSTVSLDSDLTYTFTVSNLGPLSAPGVVLDSRLPAGVTATGASTSRGFANVATSDRVTATLGTLASNATATVTITARAATIGTHVAEANVMSAIFDPNTTNNTAIAATTTVSESADVAVTITNNPTSVVEGGTLVYTVGVVNNGPSVAQGVVVTNALTVGTFLPDSSSSECSFSNGVVTCNLGSLASGSNVVLTIAVEIPVAPGAQTDIVNVVGVSTTTAESNVANNVAMVTTPVLELADIVLVSAGLVSEKETPNNAIDPGEAVVVSFSLQNISGIATTDVMATLQSSGGLTPYTDADWMPGVATVGEAVSYGQLKKGDAATSRDFRFRANGQRGETITATLMLSDGGGSLGVVIVRFLLGEDSRLVSTAEINIPGDQSLVNALGPADPYPSTLAVSGLAGGIVKATVTISNLTHDFPDDLNILLVSPTGQGVVLMSDVGGGLGLSGVTLTFDDEAAASLPDNHSPAIVSGSYRPTNASDPNEQAPVDDFPAPAPAGPYASTLSSLAGSNPDGTWSLYIVDDQGYDHGSIADGWSLQLVTLVTINDQVMLSLRSLEGGATPGQPVKISVAGRVGMTYVLEASSDLKQWTPVMTNSTMNGVVTFQDAQGMGQERRFYRTSEK